MNVCENIGRELEKTFKWTFLGVEEFKKSTFGGRYKLKFLEYGNPCNIIIRFFEQFIFIEIKPNEEMTTDEERIKRTKIHNFIHYYLRKKSNLRIRMTTGQLFVTTDTKLILKLNQYQDRVNNPLNKEEKEKIKEALDFKSEDEQKIQAISLIGKDALKVIEFIQKEKACTVEKKSAIYFTITFDDEKHNTHLYVKNLVKILRKLGYTAFGDKRRN